mmetsp:Transcript_86164/g.271731  ORF Transcript_86164/g.271731 Transcript_86164/m.271731 type:complete len:243 (+) Transcript_86164:351-1079(+)
MPTSILSKWESPFPLAAPGLSTASASPPAPPAEPCRRVAAAEARFSARAAAALFLDEEPVVHSSSRSLDCSSSGALGVPGASGVPEPESSFVEASEILSVSGASSSLAVPSSAFEEPLSGERAPSPSRPSCDSGGPAGAQPPSSRPPEEGLRATATSSRRSRMGIIAWHSSCMAASQPKVASAWALAQGHGGQVAALRSAVGSCSGTSKWMKVAFTGTSLLPLATLLKVTQPESSIGRRGAS